MKTQKELLNSYMDIVKNELYPTDEKMQAYMKKSCGYVVELSNGDLIALDKPSIKKNFCFGYGFCGMSTAADYDAAAKMSDYAATNTDYFINKNMKPVNDYINGLNECLTGDKECYTFIAYTNQPNNSKLKGFNITRICNDPDYNPGYWNNCKDLKKLSKDDIKALLNGYEEIKKAFMKRLETYLKKYGLKNVNTWTYLSD